MTLQQTIEAKIASAEAELATLRADLVGLQSSASEWLQKEESEIKALFSSFAKYL